MVFISQGTFSVDHHRREPGDPLGDGVPAGKGANNVEDGFLNSDTVQASAAGMEETPHVGTEAGSYCLALDL